MLNFKYSLPVRNTLAMFMATSLALLVSGCGSSSDQDVSTTSISGSVFASHVSGASCEVKNSNGLTIAGPFSTDSSGVYSTDIATSDLANDLMLMCSGGTYTDEADGSTQTAETLTAHVKGGTLNEGDSIHATPGSSIIQQLISTHNMTMTQAQEAFNGAFGYTPDTSVAPTDATSPATDATNEELLAGLRAAAFSQLTTDLQLAPAQQFKLITALARDLSNGSLDGKDDSGVINIDGITTPLSAGIQNQFAKAMLNFREGANDATGLANNAIGSLPFGKTVLTENYKVEYIPGMMDAMQGKSQFQIRVTNRTTEAGVSQNVSLMPMMHMEAHEHSTAIEGCIEDSNLAGTYNCTLYYVMASSMMDGTSMGYWDVKVIIGGMMMNGMMMNGEEAHFYPPVMMAMGDTTLARLKSDTDKIPDMMGMLAARNHFLFKSDLSGMTGNHSFQIFVAAQESMMSFPALYENVTLHHMEMNENSEPVMIEDLTVSSMTVKMSTTPEDAESWVTADSSDDGYWTASGITGLTNGMQGTIYVQLEINGEQYSTDGLVADSTNGYAMFTVTPGSSGMDM